MNYRRNLWPPPVNSLIWHGRPTNSWADPYVVAFAVAQRALGEPTARPTARMELGSHYLSYGKLFFV